MKNVIQLDSPASKWEFGLPVGNGRLGAMIMGQVNEEVIPLNEETIWYGGPLERNNPDALRHMDEIRRLLRRGEVEKAAFLAKTAMTSCPKYLTAYLPAGDLRISFLSHRGAVTDYCRTLDVDHAAARVSYRMDGGEWERDYFVSRAQNVLAVRIRGSKPITLAANLNRRPYEEQTGKLDEKTAGIWGQCGAGGVCYFGAVRMVAEGGRVESMGDYVTAHDADAVILYVSFATDFGGNEAYRAACLACLDEAERMGYTALRAEHECDWSALYGRVDLDLGAALPSVPTSTLLEQVRGGADARALETLLFNVGRYLLISSSTSCRMPATLQGIWNGSFTPPWESKYTININTEMNYWPAEICALPECHMPLFDLVERMEKRGRKTAREVYGCDGFVAHHNTNLWADTGIEGVLDASPIWPMGGAWLSLHLYEHFLFTQDEDFLRTRALPVLESAVTFFCQYLTPDEDGTLLSGPTISPENTYISSAGQRGALCMAPTMDSQILRELIGDYLSACKRLGIDRPLMLKAADVLSLLPKTEVSSDGRIREWHEDYAEVEPGHRHMSHLFGLYPGSQITEETPELFEAASRTLDYRLSHGGGHTGWSRAWVICFYARLKQGDKAVEHLKALLARSMQDNMLDTCPPFQIDGNFGAAAGIAELLVQSHNPFVELLPALPGAWTEGRLTGVRLRGGMKLDLFWQDSGLERAVLTADSDRETELRYRGKSACVRLRAGVPFTVTGALFRA